MSRRRRWSTLLLGVVVLVVQLIAVPVARAAAEGPLGRQNWVVSSAGFRNDAFLNYVRLGYVVFGAGNTVEQNFWSWSQAGYPASVASGDVYYCGQWTPGTNPRNNCAVRTATGFTGTPTGRLTGVYAYTAATGKVDITWTSSTVDGSTTAVSLVEHWTVSQSRPDLARMELSSSEYSLTSGIGYGSIAGLDTGSKALMKDIRSRSETFLLEGYSWHDGGIQPKMVRGREGGLVMNTWNLCDDGSCLGRVQNEAGCLPSSCCQEGPGYAACAERLAESNRRFYYMSGAFGGRRNTYEYWCECLSYDGCYTRNSHVKPMLQVIGDRGAFHGWVGVEVSPDRSLDNGRDLASETYSSFELIV